MKRFHVMQTASTFVALAGALCLFAAAGCGGGDGPAASPPAPAANGNGGETVESTNASDNSTQPAKVSATGSGNATGQVRVDADGRKWLGDVPYDVWFGDPLAIAADTQQVNVAANTTTQNPTTIDPPNGAGGTETSSTPPNGGGASGQIDWSTIIAAEVVDAEVTSIRERFAERLRSVGAYNSAYLELPPHIATLAVMGGVATMHPGEIRWKKNAKYIRDLAGQMGSEQLQSGPKSFKQVELPYLQIVDMLNGDTPAGLPESSDETDFYAVADFGYMMKRIDAASKWLKVTVSTQEALEKSHDDVVREASVLAALGQVLMAEGYGYADDEEFCGYALEVVEGGKSMTEAARSKDFAAYDDGLSRVFRACTDCHGVYKD